MLLTGNIADEVSLNTRVSINEGGASPKPTSVSFGLRFLKRLSSKYLHLESLVKFVRELGEFLDRGRGVLFIVVSVVSHFL